MTFYSYLCSIIKYTMCSNVSDKDYVVLDVETNGLSSEKFDLLSISFYRPDTKQHYDRFLPLERNTDVFTTWINGITKKDLEDKEPLTQDEVDKLIADFELDKRIILTYGRIDRIFLQKYFKRNKLDGFHLLKFYNFKQSIISSPFSGGIVTKDALCNAFGIRGVENVHSGKNDCLLEWKLFKKMDNEKLFIDGSHKIYRFSDDYFVPASYLAYYSNFRYHSNSYVGVSADYSLVRRFRCRSKTIQKFKNNINGIAMEHLISVLLDAKEYKKEEKEKFLLDNKRKLQYVGKIPSPLDELFVRTNKDGSLSAIRKKDEEIVKQINTVLEEYKNGSTKLIRYLKKEIFKGKDIRYQELVIKPETKALAICDFSSEDVILEMKTYDISTDDKKLAEQLYYQSDGRPIYILSVEWFNDGVDFVILKVASLKATEKKIKPLIYQSKEKNKVARQRAPKVKMPLTEEQKRELRLERYKKRVAEKSAGSIKILKYIDSRSDTAAVCLQCGYKWAARSDKIADRGCPNCRKRGNQ